MLYDNHNTPINDCFVEVSPSFETQTGITQVKGKTAREIDPNNEGGFIRELQPCCCNGRIHPFSILVRGRGKYK
ncbi:hypothetical protein [uncultured Nostoc sp.]|uniref:hypothetical protein n=1 Tax=uncultured Nostoc sp. TaxID=340711 RepID=UPI0035CB45C6